MIHNPTTTSSYGNSRNCKCGGICNNIDYNCEECHRMFYYQYGNFKANPGNYSEEQK